MTKLLYLGGVLNQTRRAIHFAGGYHRQLFETAHKQIHTICDFIKDTKPFCWFDVEDSLRLVDHAFASSALDEVDKMYSGSIKPGTEETYALIGRIKETQRLATYLIGVYCYLCNDTANFSTMMVNYVQHLMCCRSRQKSELALLAAAFCNNKEMQEQLEAANLNKELDGVNLRTRVTSVSAVMFDEQDSAYIVRRLYFGRLMDFFVTEWFEGMENGHYLWRCGVCKQYFLMTTAHRQLYCKNFNPKYGTTCDHVANNRRISKEKGLERQKKKDNPLWIIRNKRYASIRKNKSLGKYSDAVSDEAKQLLDGYFQMAESDTRYADEHYIEDIQLENLYRQAEENLR